MQRIFLIAVALCAGAVAAVASDVFTIHDAIDQAVRTNPGVGEAAANRRAAEAELRPQQGTLLPQGRLQADAAPETIRRGVTRASRPNRRWVNGCAGCILVRRTLFVRVIHST